MLVSKKSRLGAPVELHYSAMTYSLVARIIERIPAIKDLIRRFRQDLLFRLNCGFMLSEFIPSEASYSRLIQINITSDLRKYMVRARGSVFWSNIAKRRSAVERVNAYLKGYFQLNQFRHRSDQKAKAHLNLVSLVYSATRLAVDRMNRQIKAYRALSDYIEFRRQGNSEYAKEFEYLYNRIGK